jgi:hypothetical protein
VAEDKENIRLNTVISILFGLLILSVPMLIAGTIALLAAASLPLIPIAMPLTTLVVAALVLFAWIRHKRYLLRGW